MSTLKTTSIQHPLAPNPAIVLSADGSVVVEGGAGGGGGQVLQTIFAKNSTTVNTTRNVFEDTNLTATITPTSASNKILVTLHQNGVGYGGGTLNGSINIRLMRDDTQIHLPGTAVGYTGNTSTVYVGSVSTSYLDAPATTSAIVYKTQFNSGDNSGTAGVQKNGSESTIILQEIAQ